MSPWRRVGRCARRASCSWLHVSPPHRATFSGLERCRSSGLGRSLVSVMRRDGSRLKGRYVDRSASHAKGMAAYYRLALCAWFDRPIAALAAVLAMILASLVAGASHADTGPSLPRSGGFDWLQFRNGEWLKGAIKDFLDHSLTFESDQLNTLQIDWDDVYALYSAKENTVVLDGRAAVTGLLRIEGNEVTVVTPEGEQHYERDELRGIIPGGLRERDYWSIKWSVGFTARSGNVEQADLASFTHIQRRSPGLRTRFESAGNYGSFEGQQTTNNQQASLRHDVFLNRRLYVVPVNFQFYRDKFQNIAYRLTPGASVGYDLVDRGKTEWNASIGGGYQYTRFDEVEAGEAKAEEGAALLVATDFGWDLTTTMEFALKYNTVIGVSGPLSVDHHALAMLSFDTWKNLDFDVSLTWDRVGGPRDRPDGSSLRNDDLRMYVGIGWEF